MDQRTLLAIAAVLTSGLGLAGCTRHDARDNGNAGPASQPPGTSMPAPPSQPGGSPTTRPPQNAATPTSRTPLPTATAEARLRADSLRSQARCGGTGSLPIVDLSWHPAPSRDTQRIVYTPYADGYRSGRYEITGDLKPDAATWTVEGLSPGSVYTWLVLTRHGTDWQPSAAARFTAPVCAADQASG